MGRWRKRSLLALIAGVPLVVAGLFVGALSQADTGIERVPAAIVNQDEMVQQTLPDGTQQPVLAGRLLVTELTSDDAQAFDWTITNEEEAEDMLSRGDVYAVLTVPKNFSKSITSLSQPTPERARLTVETDDAHGYLTGAATQAVGTGMVAVFGNDITAQYVNGVFTGFSSISGAFSQAADGADQLSDGATSLGAGLDELTGGVVASQEGATELADGVAQYTAGVDQLSAGLGRLSTGASQLDQLSEGITQYTAGVGQFTGGLRQLLSAVDTSALPSLDPALLQRLDPSVLENIDPAQLEGLDPRIQEALGRASEALSALQALPVDQLTQLQQLQTQLDQLPAQLDQLDAAGQQLSQGAAGIDQLQSGLEQSASGAAQLSTGSAALRNGAAALAGGLGPLADGTSASADGVIGLATGASELADGLEQGADGVPSYTESEAEGAAGVVADPIALTVERDNEVGDVASGISSLVVPLGLWLGALAIFLVLRPLARRALASPAPTGRLLRRSLGGALAIAAVQALLLVALLHTAVGIDWALLPVTLVFSLLMAGAFTAFHYLLTVAFGRTGLVVSLLLLAIQLTATGGLYPIQLVAEPFRAVSPYLPLTYGVQGMQSIVAGGSAGPVITAIVVLALFGLVSALLSYLAVRRSRRATALGLVPATA